MPETLLDTTYFSATCIDGIVELQYKDGIYITLAVAKKIVQERLELFGDATYLLLYKTSKLKGMDRAARQYLFSEGLKNIKVIALVHGNKVGQMLATFMIAFKKLPIPCKTFHTHEEARVWLKNFS